MKTWLKSIAIIFVAVLSFATYSRAADKPPTEQRPLKVSDLLSAIPAELVPLDVQPGTVVPKTVEEALSQVFTNSGCPLPKDLKKKLEEREDQSSKNWMPEELRAGVGKDVLAQNIKSVKMTSVSAVLHVIRVQDGDKSPDLPVLGASTYATLDPQKLLDSQQGSTAYCYDCSGFMNAALALDVKVPWADIQQNAKVALNEKRALVAIIGSLFSPLAMAIHPGGFPFQLDPRDRIDLLYAILVALSDAGATDTSHITAPREIAVLWTSNQGNSSFQGKADLRARAGGALWVIKATTEGTAGGELARTVEFKQFATYVLNDQVIEPLSTSLSQISSALVALVRSAGKFPPKTVDESFEVLADLPANVCSATEPWTITQRDSNVAIPGSVKTEWSPASGCTLTATSDSEQMANIRTKKGFKLVRPVQSAGPKIALELEVKVP